MRSRLMLLLHTLLFFLFVLGSLASPLLARWYPGVSPWHFITATVFLFALVVGSWIIFGGCPFTIWENSFRKSERRAMYKGPCIDHYAYRWFGIRTTERVSTSALVVLLLLPAAVGLTGIL